MSLPIRKTAQAEEELAAIGTDLGERAGVDVVERLLAAVENALSDLAAMPGMGSPWESPLTRLQGIRTWAVPGFRNHLIFYREAEGELELLRVLHGARDLHSDDIAELQ